MSDIGYLQNGRGHLAHRVLDRLAVIKTRAATLRRYLHRGESTHAQTVNEHLDEIDQQVDEAALLVRLIHDSDPTVAT